MRHTPSGLVLHWAPRVLVAAGILAIAYLIAEASSSSAAFSAATYGNASTRPTVGTPAPEFAAVDVDGTRFRLSEYRGRPVWINFWATWCPPCRAEMPEINAVYQELQSKGLVLLAVSVGEDQQTVRDYLNKAGYAIPAVLDDGSIAGQYALSGFPTHYFIDKDGIVRDIRVGGLSKQALQEHLARILPPD